MSQLTSYFDELPEWQNSFKIFQDDKWFTLTRCKVVNNRYLCKLEGYFKFPCTGDEKEKPTN